MFVKVHQSILDSTLAEDRRLRHFFTDLLLCSDPDGNVTITKDAIRRRINAPMEEVEWGIGELMKPDLNSHTPDFEGRRIIPIPGVTYGWHIVNYQLYRGLRTSDEVREQTRLRVAAFRARQPGKNGKSPKARPGLVTGGPPRERLYAEAVGDGEEPDGRLTSPAGAAGGEPGEVGGAAGAPR